MMHLAAKSSRYLLSQQQVYPNDVNITVKKIELMDENVNNEKKTSFMLHKSFLALEQFDGF